MSQVEEISRMIELHKATIEAHNVLFEQNDHGKVDDKVVSAALGPIDDALIALCATKPTAPDASRIRREYLSQVLVADTYCNSGMAQAVFDAFLADPPATDIEIQYNEWRANCEEEQPDTEEACNEQHDRYTALQDKIVSLKPASARDLAIRYLVDTDQFGSDNSEEFVDLIKELVSQGRAS